MAIVGRGGDKRFLHDQWVTWLGRWDTLILNHKGYSKSNRTQLQKYVSITNWGSFVLLQIRANVFTNGITNQGNYYEFGHNSISLDLSDRRYFCMLVISSNVQMLDVKKVKIWFSQFLKSGCDVFWKVTALFLFACFWSHSSIKYEHFEQSDKFGKRWKAEYILLTTTVTILWDSPTLIHGFFSTKIIVKLIFGIS